MTAPTVAVAEGSESSAPTLGDEIGAMFGDFVESPSSGESPESGSTSPDGTTPNEPAPETAGTDPNATTTAPEAGDAGAAGTTPDAQANAAQDDPFKDTTPATFMVNGQPVTSEDIRVFKEGGAVIRPEALPSVLAKLSERESLQERNHRQSQEYQTLSKVTEWADQSTGKTLNGAEGAIANRVANAVLFAENKLLIESLSNRATLRSLLTTEQVPDGKGGLREEICLNPAALAQLQRENALQQREITAAIRDHYKTVIAEASKPGPAPVNYESETPKLVAELAKQASLDASVLTKDDLATLAEQLPFHTKDGLASVAWQNLAKRLMADRASQKTSSQQLVTSTADATRKGLANMAAAARGVRQPVAKVPVVQQRQPSQQSVRAKNEGDLFDAMQRAGSKAMRAQP